MKRNLGLIREKLEIKILILFILRRLPEPVTFEALTGLAMCDDGISYFDYCECVAELVKTEHLRYKHDKYSITEKGIRNGGITEDSLPYPVRVHAENIASSYRSAQARSAMIKTSRTANEDGSYKVASSLSDGLGEILSLEMLAANEKQARALENGFRRNAEGVYNALIGIILES